MKISRRQFLIGSAAVAACTVLPGRAALAFDTPGYSYEPLNFYSLHTHERIALRYRDHGAYFPSALAQAKHFFRDHRNNDSIDIDPKLLDHIYTAAHHFGIDRTIEVISAYRSPATNDMLASRSNGVAKGSYHTKGMAMDINIQGVAVEDLFNFLVECNFGGAGKYNTSGFVHLDTGPVRSWIGV